jgi:hypothetical protein
VEISTERIMQLPDDDIPDEILHGVRQCTDTGVVDQESDGYVPTNEEDNVEAGSDADGKYPFPLFITPTQIASKLTIRQLFHV